MTPLSHYLIFSSILFAVGLAGALMRRNILVVFMCLELMLTAANVSLVAFSRAQGTEGVPVYDAQVLTLFIMAIAAAEVAVGLALIVAMFRARRTVDSTSLNSLKD
ncbi:MAG: NADH-quinone oxidoreductase subunit NuoK [Akkermansiaceae bacterium]|nr:NADH-quinone oxidoreductase subunit NuoK [Akkermansiaceae bacterium]